MVDSAVLPAYPVASNPGDVALSAHEVSVRYGGVAAVERVTLSVRPGEIAGLIGPNGAGKTSFIDAISGFVATAGGTVHLNGACIDSTRAHLRARRGLIRTFQQLELFTDLSVRENIQVAAASTGRGRQGDVERAIDLLGLDDVLDVQVADLSQGRRRMVALARAVASVPTVLLLDEPAAGLDTDESQGLGQQLRQLADDGVAILLVDHDMGLVLSVCDTVTVIEFGKVIATGAPSAIRADKRVLSAYLGD